MPKRERTAADFNLHERTRAFGRAIILFCKSVRGDDIDRVLIRQLVRSGTSVGANYREANNAESPADFKHKIGISRKEADESKYWVEMVVTARPDLRDAARGVWQEAHELHLILSKIRRTLK